MTYRGFARRAAAVAAAVFIGASVMVQAAAAQSAGKESRPLKMEEVEVRGYREKPGQLFLPVPRAIYSPSPVRFDLLREDIGRPIPPGEVPNDRKAKGGAIDDKR